MGMDGKRKHDEGEATDDVEEERAGNSSNKKRQILPSSIKNKEKRSAIHAKIKHEKKLEKKKKSKAREIDVKKALELGEEANASDANEVAIEDPKKDEKPEKVYSERIMRLLDQDEETPKGKKRPAEYSIKKTTPANEEASAKESAASLIRQLKARKIMRIDKE